MSSRPLLKYLGAKWLTVKKQKKKTTKKKQQQINFLPCNTALFTDKYLTLLSLLPIVCMLVSTYFLSTHPKEITWPVEGCALKKYKNYRERKWSQPWNLECPAL